jgi:hypothetical protein
VRRVLLALLVALGQPIRHDGCWVEPMMRRGKSALGGVEEEHPPELGQRADGSPEASSVYSTECAEV